MSAPADKSSIGEPLEQGTSAATSVESKGLREAQIRQAEAFLRDPRVQGSDPARAAAFLRSKKIGEPELQVAFQRIGLPLPPPSEEGTPFSSSGVADWQPHYYPRPHMHPAAPHIHLEQQQSTRGSSWARIILGIAAAAGLYATVRELLRTYVVPLYFPDEGRCTSDSELIIKQEREIAKLRATIAELQKSSRETNERIDRLSQTVSTGGGRVYDLPAEEAFELRDAIRQLSQTVSASAGTPVSNNVNVMSRLQELQGQVNHLKLLTTGKNGKEGSLAYSGNGGDSASDSTNQTPISQHEVFMTPMMPPAGSTRKRTPTELSSDNQKPKTHIEDTSKEVFHNSNVAAVSSVQSVHSVQEAVSLPLSGNLNQVQKKDNEQDDFMDVPPAVVENGWAPEGPTSQVSGAMDSKRSSDKIGAFSSGAVSSVESVDAAARVREISSINSAVEIDKLATSRKLFQQDSMFREAHSLFENGGVLHSTAESKRPRSSASAPDMDLPLSDTES